MPMSAGGAGPVPGVALGSAQALREDHTGGGDRRAGVAGGVFGGDAVQLDGGRAEPAAVVAEQDGPGQATGDRGGRSGRSW